MKSQFLKIVVFGSIWFTISQNMFAQEKQNRNIISVGTAALPQEWQLQYKIGIGREFQIGYGFSFISLAEYAEYPRYRIFGNGAVLANEPSYSFSFSGTLKVSPSWRIAPYFAYGAEWIKAYEGGITTVDVSASVHRNPAHWFDDIYTVLNLGLDFFPANKISAFIELKIDRGQYKPGSKFYGGSALCVGAGFVL